MAEYVTQQKQRPTRTTISVSDDVRDTLIGLKKVKEEPYNNVLKRMIKDIVDVCLPELETQKERRRGEWVDDEGRLTSKTINLLKERLDSLEAGRVMSTKELRQRLRQQRENDI